MKIEAFTNRYETYTIGKAEEYLVPGRNVIALYGSFVKGFGGRWMDAGLSVRSGESPK